MIEALILSVYFSYPISNLCAVPRWGEVEANGNGSTKDVDRLLRTHKSIAPERDAWYVITHFLYTALLDPLVVPESSL